MEIKYTDAYKSAEEITDLNWKIVSKNTIPTARIYRHCLVLK
jgi:hypothetical protein